VWPEHIIDVKAAICWVKDNIASYGGDPERIVLMGASAGGHLASLAALTPNLPCFQPGFEECDTSVQVSCARADMVDLC
jgi:acetyl esterase/lipase